MAVQCPRGTIVLSVRRLEGATCAPNAPPPSPRWRRKKGSIRAESIGGLQGWCFKTHTESHCRGVLVQRHVANARRCSTIVLNPAALPVKRHRGEPGHRRDKRAHTGTRITQTNLTTIQTHYYSTPARRHDRATTESADDSLAGLGEFSIQEKGNFNTRYHHISSYIMLLS